MRVTLHLAAALIVAPLATASAAGITLRTEPAAISFVNWFTDYGDGFFVPSDTYEFSVSAPVASTVNGDAYLGQTLDFDYTVAPSGYLPDGSQNYSFALNGISPYMEPTDFLSGFYLSLPVEEYYDPDLDRYVFTSFEAPWEQFFVGLPPDSEFPDVLMSFRIIADDPLPTKTVSEYYTAGYEMGWLREESGLTEIDGFEVFEDSRYDYIEGVLENAVFEISSVYQPDDPLPPVPLPAGLPLILLGLGGLSIAARKKQAT